MASKKWNSYIGTDSILNYTLYAASLSQASTSAPSATVFINGFGATTFTWARTSAGLYTVTANSAIFTANKTFVSVSPPTLDLVSFKAIVSSTTVITLTTNLLSVIATVLTPTATDVLLSNNLFQIQVYD